MSFRSDVDALSAQADALRRELGAASKDARDRERLTEELAAKVRLLESARLTRAEKQTAARRIRWRALLIGAVVGSTIAVGVFLFVRAEAPTGPADAQAWFQSIKGQCNAVEATSVLARRAPPPGWEGRAYVAACQTLAGNVPAATEVIAHLDAIDRPRAAGTVFRVIHPAADAGDDVAAGPGMELVLTYQPRNFMALYHAGMAAYENGEASNASERLELFLEVYHREDGWTARARKALAALDGP